MPPRNHSTTSVIDPPNLVVPIVHIRQPDGSILSRPGKAIIIEDMVGVSEAARILGMSCRWVQSQCTEGNFTTARKVGFKLRSRWKIGRTEILDRLSIKID
jgi:hypothetical protein